MSVELEKDFVEDLKKDGLSLEGEKEPTEVKPPADGTSKPVVDNQPEKKPGEKQGEEKPPESKPADQKPPEKKPDNQPRAPRTVEPWEIKKTQAQFSRDLENLRNDIFKELDVRFPKPAAPEEKKPDSKPSPKYEEVRGKIAEKWGLAPEDVDELAEAIRSGIPQAELSPELKEKLGKLDTFEQQQNENAAKERARLEAEEFQSEFETSVLPLIKEEYPDLPSEKLSEIRDKLKELAYQPRYAGKINSDKTVIEPVPLEEIFRGRAEFRNIEGLVTALPGTGARGEKGMVDYSKLSEEEFLKLPLEEQQKATEYLEQSERRK